MGKLDDSPKEKDKPKITGLKIDGDKATATVVSTVKGKEKKEPITFVRSTTVADDPKLDMGDEEPKEKKETSTAKWKPAVS